MDWKTVTRGKVRTWFMAFVGLVIAKAVDVYFDLELFSAVFTALADGVTAFFAVSVSLPLWLAVIVSLALLAAIGWLTLLLWNQSRVLQQVNTRILELENPKAPLLNPDQMRVLTAISEFYQRGYSSSREELIDKTKFSLLVIDGALDVLFSRGLIDWERYKGYGTVLFTLSTAGRAYLLSPEISSEYWNQGAESNP